MHHTRPARGLVYLFAILLVGIVPTADAAKNDYANVATVNPVWTAHFDRPVEWQRVTPMGQLVVATGSTLHGVDPSSGAIQWSHVGLARPDADSFETIPGTPLFVISTSGISSRTLIVDSTAGRVLFDSSASGIINILHRVPLYETGGLLVMGQQGGDLAIKLFLVDLATGNMRWVNDKVLSESSGMNKVAGLLARLSQVTEQPESAGSAALPVEVGPDAVVMASFDGIVKVSSATGEVLWRVKNRDGQGRPVFFVPPQRSDLVVVANEQSNQSSSGTEMFQTYYAAHKIEDGSPVWSKSVKMKGVISPPVFLDDGLIVSPGGDVKGKIKFVRYDSGKSVWGKNGKGIPSKGGIVDHHMTDAGMVVTTGYDSAWTNKGTSYFLNVLDVDAGTYRFAKEVKVRGRVLSAQVVPKGVLYVTTSEVNIFDPATGTSRFGKAVVSDESLTTADDGDSVYAFSRDDGALFRIDKSAATVVRLGETKVELEGKDVPRALEVSGDRVTLIGTQSVVGFDRQGKVEFHTYHPAPRHPTWLRALLIAQSVRAGMAAAAAGANGAAFAHVASTQESGTLQREVTEELATGYSKLSEGYVGLSKDYARVARQRFQASAQSRDSVFMMVKLDKGYGLAQVDKADGNVRGMIRIGKDKTPEYQVDDVAQRVYFSAGGNMILGYAF